MPFTAPLSPSVKLVTSADTSVPELLPSATSSAIVVSVLAAATGASFTAVTAIAAVDVTGVVPSETVTVSVSPPVVFAVPW